MKRVGLRILLAGSLLVSLYGAVRADVIADWNEKAVNAGNTARVGNFPTARAIAMVHLAMFEALNSIEPRYTPDRAKLSAHQEASREAAAASAAHAVLVGVYPEQASELDKALQASLSAVMDGLPIPKAFRSGNRRAPRSSPSAATTGSSGPGYLPTVRGRRAVCAHGLANWSDRGGRTAIFTQIRKSVAAAGALLDQERAVGNGLQRS